MTTYQHDSVIHPTKIVLIEDNAAVTNWITAKITGIKKLKLAGISNNYSGAFELITRENPDIVILDLRLPDGNGMNLLKEIRKVNSKITVIVLSLNTQARNTCLKMGANYFFDKSLQLNDFVRKLNEVGL